MDKQTTENCSTNLRSVVCCTNGNLLGKQTKNYAKDSKQFSTLQTNTSMS